MDNESSDVGDGEKYVFEGGESVRDSAFGMIILILSSIIFFALIFIIFAPDSLTTFKGLGSLVFIEAILVFILYLYYRGQKSIKKNPATIIIEGTNITIKRGFWFSDEVNKTLSLNKENIVKVIPIVDWKLNEEFIKKYKSSSIKFYDSDKLKTKHSSVGGLNDKEALYRILNKCFVVIDKEGIHYMIIRDIKHFDHMIQLISPMS